MRARAAEFIGTFALVFAGCGAIAIGRLSPAGIAFAFGLVIAVCVWAFGPISGAHFNPAVSVGLALLRRVSPMRALTYIAAQVAGAGAGALMLALVLGSNRALGVTAPSGAELQSLVMEALLTCFLMLVVAVAAESPTPALAPLAIGGTVALGALVGGPISGASMNPARSIGPALVAGDYSHLWVYLVGPMAGASAAAIVSKWLRAERSVAVAVRGPDGPHS